METLTAHQVALVAEPRGEEMALVVLELLDKVMLVVLAVMVTQFIRQTVEVALGRQGLLALALLAALAELV
jgi:hypothetical protein